MIKFALFLKILKQCIHKETINKEFTYFLASSSKATI